MFASNDNKSQVVRERSREEVREQLVQQYGEPSIDVALHQSLVRLEDAFGKLSAVSGKRILDLGCGSTEGSLESDKNPPGTWAPWLPRAVVELGGYAVGLDVGFADTRDSFEYHRADLFRANALGFLNGQTFDAINCSHFFSSPHIIFNMGIREEAPRMAVRESLKAQCEKLLKPGGIFIEFDDNFRDF